MIHLTALAGTLAALSSFLAAPVDVETVAAAVKEIDITNREAKPPVSPVSFRLTLGAVPAGVTVPNGMVDASYGTTKDLAVFVGKSEATKEQPDLIDVDADANGKLAPDERHPLAVTMTKRGENQIATSSPVELTLASGAKFQALYSRSGERPGAVSLFFNRYLEGSIGAGLIAVVDKDLDGLFGSAGDAWTITAKGARPATEYALMLLNESVFRDGKNYRVTVTGDLMSVASEAATGPDLNDAAAQRARVEHMWMERFEPEREKFFADRGLDASRPVAKAPIQWRYVSFADAIAMGEKEKKPVFIDVMAFWCVWCYRMDWCTYPDAEVTRMLNEDFIPVKIIQEQDLAGDYDVLMKDKLKAEGIPAMGVFDATGKAIHTIGGWKKPEDFLKELEAGKAAFAGQ
jgi:thiol-disulfide isomerase/thioredoxin